MNDIINHSPHYNAGEIECIDVLKDWFSSEQYAGFLKGNVIKYLCREGHKENRLQDCEKAKYYLIKLVEHLSKAEKEKNIQDCSTCKYFTEEYDEWCENNCINGIPDSVASENYISKYERKEN